MGSGHRVALCHLAALKDDVIPPDPRLYLRTVSPHEVTISLGSLAFMRPHREAITCSISKERNNAFSSAETYNDIEKDGGTQCSSIRPKGEMLLTCSIFKDAKKVSSTVTIRINKRHIFCASTDSRGNGSIRAPQVKHRNTYYNLMYSKQAPPQRIVTCKLIRTSQRNCAFMLKRIFLWHTSLQVTDAFSTASSCNSMVPGIVKRPIKGSSSEEGWYNYLSYLKLFRKSCDKCFRKFRCDVHRIKFPAIIKIDTILRFQMWQNIRHPLTKLFIHCELQRDGLCLGRLELDISPLPSPVNCYVGMFRDVVTRKNANEYSCNIRDCCCNCDKRMVCSSHIVRMLGEIRRLVSLLFSYDRSYTAATLGKYRYLLYLYIQILCYSSSSTLRSCGDTVPFAILTVGVVEFLCDDFSGEIEDGALTNAFSKREPIKGSLYVSPFNQTQVNLVTQQEKCLLPENDTSANHYLQLAEDFHRRHRNKRRVSLFYVGPTFKESEISHQRKHQAPPLNLPTYGIPINLEFFACNDFYYDEYIICRGLRDLITIHSRMYTPGSGMKFFMEPPELAFLKSLVKTPLYSVGMSPEMLRSMVITTSFGEIGYDKINRLLWKYLPLLSSSGECLPTFLRFVDWQSESEASKALDAMKRWKLLDVITLMELLSIDFSPPRCPEAVQQHSCNTLVEKYTIEQLSPFFPGLLVTPGAKQLVSSLVTRYCNDYSTAINLYWGLEGWSKSQPGSSNLLDDLLATFADSRERSRILDAIKAQRTFRRRLIILMRHIRSDFHGYAHEKSLKLLEFLQSESRLEVFHGLRARTAPNNCERIIFDCGIPLFTDNSLCIYGLDTASCRVIKTSRYPLLLTLHLSDANCYKQGTPLQIGDYNKSQLGNSSVNEAELNSLIVKQIMFKDGDDLRLDQVCQQIAKLSGDILRSHGFEPYIKCYEVLATSSNDGFVEFLNDTKSISAVLTDDGSIEAYLFDEGTSSTEALTKRLNFTASLASYSVLCYLLGVGDRHNDNLVLCKSGHIVHVDYGYILGSEPHVIPHTPFKLSQEMLEFLGGHGSYLYHKFKERFYVVFSILRSHAKIIITMMYMLVGHDLPKVNLSSVVEMETRFKLSVKDELVLRREIDYMIESSVAAFATQLTDKWHQFSMWWK